jgi:hypothetical protein
MAIFLFYFLKTTARRLPMKYQQYLSDEINPKTRIGAVHLNVADLEKMTSFYRDAIGLPLIEKSAGRARLGFGEPLVEVRANIQGAAATATSLRAGLVRYPVTRSGGLRK